MMAARSCFDTAPLKSPLHIVGNGFARLRIAADRKQALAAVRICDVAPDGTSAMVSFGILNLAHRNSHEFPEPLKPGKFYDVSVPLKSVAQTIPKGHRLRLAVSSTYWPMVWPSPEDVTLTVDAAKSRLDLPVLGSFAGLGGVKFGPPDFAPDAVDHRFRAGGGEAHHPPRDRDRDHHLPDQERRRPLRHQRHRHRADLDPHQDLSHPAQRPDRLLLLGAVHPVLQARRLGCALRQRGGGDERTRRTSTSPAWVKAYDHGKIFATREYKEKIKRDCM